MDVQQRVEARMEDERDELRRLIAKDRDAQRDAWRLYRASLERVGRLSTDLGYAYDEPGRPTAELESALDAEHGIMLRLKQAANGLTPYIDGAEGRLAALDDEARDERLTNARRLAAAHDDTEHEMNWITAAEAVLKDEGGPLHYREITNRALDAGLITTKGKTPEASMNAKLAVSLKDGDDSPFVKVATGVFALRAHVGAVV